MHMPLFSYQSEMCECLCQTILIHRAAHMIGRCFRLGTAAAHGHADGASLQHRHIHDRIAKGDGILDLSTDRR